MFSKKVLATAILSSLVLAACSADSHSEKEFGSFTYRAIKEDVGKDAGVVFYRDNSGMGKTAVNIAINSEYQASLQRNGYTEAIVCAQPQKLGAFLTSDDITYVKKLNEGKYYKLHSGAVSYFKVSIVQGKVVLTEVSKEIAKKEIDPKKYQSNTLSRVSYANTCGEPKYILDASALFPFNQSSFSSILPDGRKEIKAVAEDIKLYPERISAIEIIGHTDPQGTKNYNDQLSQQRAESVKTLFQEFGIAPNLLRARGVGSSDLIAKDCLAKFPNNSEALNACNQPNRRVEVKLHTVKN